MVNKYYCPRCKTDFYKEAANINERHRCGSFAYLEWGTKAAEDEEGS